MTPDPPEPSGPAPDHDDPDSPEPLRASRENDGLPPDLVYPIEPSFRHFAESLPELVWSARPDGTTDYFNGRLLDYLGTTAAGMLGRDWPEMLHADDAGRARRAWEQACATGSDFEAEFRFRRHDGQHRWHRVSASAMRDDSGRVARWFGICTDIHDQGAGVQDARRRERLLRSITDNATTAIFVMDDEGRTTFMNPAAEAMIGYTFREAEGQILHELVHHHRPDGSPFPMDECPIGRHVLGQQDLRGHEDVFVRRDGTFFPVRCAARPIMEDGALTGIVLEVQDITEERRAEERLRDSERRFARFMEHLPGLAWIKDARGRYVYANETAERAFCTPRADLYGRTDEEVFSPETAAQFRAHDRQAMEAGEGVQVVETLEHGDGVLHHALVSKFPMPGPEGEALVGGIAIDITERLRAEAALVESEGRFRGLMEQAPFSVQVFDPGGRTLAANRAWEGLWGLTFEQLADYNVLADPQLEAKGVLPHLRRAFAGEPAQLPAIEYDLNETMPDRTRHADPRRWVSAVAYPLKDAAGRVREVVLVHDDITERVRAEEALRRGEERLRLIVESATDYAIFAMDLDGKVTSWNSGASNLLGYEEEEILGRDASLMFIREDVDRGVPEQEIQKALERGRAENERWHVRKDGTLFWASGLMMPMREGDEVVGLLKIMRDTTEQKRVEQELEVSRERLDFVVNSSEVGLWYCDLPLDRLVWNSKCKEQFGLPPEADVTIETFYERLHPDDREPTRRAIMRSIEGRGEYDAEFRTVDPRGRVRWIRAIGQPFYDVEGTPLRFDGITVDVTTRIEQEQALKEADRRKDEFLAMLAHELRNPLAPIRTALHLMAQPGGSGQDHEEERAMAERQVIHLARLIDDLMDVARISKGKLELHTRVVDLHTVVRQAVETARSQIDDRRHRLSVRLPEVPIRLEADPTRLEQVFWNLLNNAAKYTEPGGQIDLAVEAEDGQVVARVRDTGIGIEPEKLHRLFQMFVQLGEHRQHAQGGLGIGLGLVRTLVDLHGGSIEARSEGPGTGSEFVVRLPVLPASGPGPAPAVGDRREAPEVLPRRRILIVDDNVDAAVVMGRMLSRFHGQQVEVAHDGPSALEVAGRFRPEVVLLDIGLPGMDGHEVALRLRERPGGEQILLVALTGWGQDADRRRSREAGFDHHLVKPVDPDDLIELLRLGTRRIDPAGG